jgi:hypothetical protein
VGLHTAPAVPDCSRTAGEEALVRRVVEVQARIALEVVPKGCLSALELFQR